MAEVKWIKLDREIFNNRKIRQIEVMPRGDTLIVIWLKLLTLAGTVNNGGQVYFTPELPYTEQLLATEMNRPVVVIKKALEVFQSFGMISREDGRIQITNWEKYQAVDKLADIREYNREAQQKYRARKKKTNVNDNVNDKSMTCQPCQETEEDKDKDKDKDLGTWYPALGDIELFCQKEGLTVSPYAFWKTFDERGWMQDGEPVRNWKAMLKAWDRAKRTVSGKPDEMIMAVLKQMEDAGA